VDDHPPATRPARGRLWVPWTALGLVAVAWGALRALPSGWIDEAWLRGWLPPASRLSAAAIDAVPFSWSLLTGLLLAIALGGLALSGVRRGRRHRLVWAAVALLALGPTFELAWGLGYRRSPLEARLGLPSSRPAPEAAWAALDRFLSLAGADAPYDLERLAAGAPWWARAVEAGSACVARVDAYVVGRSEPLRLPTRLRRLPAGALLTGGFAGVQAPWWREPHVDGGLPPAAALTTGLHELVHTAGWAGEAETDALAVLAGLACDDPDVRFATALHGLLLTRAELLRHLQADPGGRAELDRRWATLPPAATAAWAASSAALARHRSPTVERAVGATYDAYLRASGVEAGLADYGRAGELLLAALERCGSFPDAPWCAEPGR